MPVSTEDPLNTERAHSARMYDYFLGGKTNYAADREAADAVLEIMPSASIGARNNRAFMHRAMRYVAAQGVDQFLDVGTGIPTEPNLHQVVQAIHPAARLVYVDNDPIVLAHAAALMTSTPDGMVAYVPGDARDPRAILATPEVRATLDLTRPVSLSAVSLLQFLDDDAATGLVRTLVDAVPSGSYLTLSHTSLDGDADGSIGRLEQIYRQTGIAHWARGRERISELFLTGLEPVEPGVTFTPRWRPDPANDFDGSSEVGMTALLAVVARKP